MAKIRINGETFDYDQSHHPMSEALAIEEATGMRYVDWETELSAGSMKAMCAFVWLVWRRNGRDVPLGDILSGEIEIDLTDLLASFMEMGQEEARTLPAGTARSPQPRRLHPRPGKVSRGLLAVLRDPPMGDRAPDRGRL